MTKIFDSADQQKQVKLGLQATVIQTCFYEKGLAKNIGGAIVVLFLFTTLLLLADGLSHQGKLFSWHAGGFIFLSAITAIAIQNFIMFGWIANLEVLNQTPALWLLPSFILFTHMIINTAHVVEIMRINNIAGRKQELLAALNGMKLYSHQIVTLVEGLASPRMVFGYAIGACVTEFLLSSQT